MNFPRLEYTDADLVRVYEQLLLPRQIEEKMLIYLRQGKISKWFSGYGQEAVSVGCALGMNTTDYLLTMHRNLGVFTARGVDLVQLFAQFQGKEAGFTKGRDRSFHFGSQAHRIVGMISHLGAQLGVADGIALAHKLKADGGAALVFCGDGGASEGDFHEALNVAAVWQLPVIFVIENNQWGLSTPSNEQFRCKSFVDKAIGYGIEGAQVDGNNVLEVMAKVRSIREGMRSVPQPFLLECITFRMRGHEEASGTKYYPAGLQDQWKAKDPVDVFEQFLMADGVLTAEQVSNMKAAATKRISEAFEESQLLPKPIVSTERELADLFAPADEAPKASFPQTIKNLRFIDAITDALDTAMKTHPELVLMGQDIAEYGGVFKATEGFVERYGKARVRNTPLCESAILGAALGLSVAGMKSMVEMQFSDFVTCGFNQIVNNLAKSHWRWGLNADVVVRMPTGANVVAGPFHSQSTEAWFTHTAGLKVVYPSNPADAKGLLLAAFADPNPVLFFEHKFLYRSATGDVPEGYYTTPIGQAAVCRQGKKATIVCYGLAVQWAIQIADAEGDVEVIDLRTLSPIDWPAVEASVKKTGRVMVLHEDVLTGGLGADVAAHIAEHCFEYLDAPVMRCASLDTPVPFAEELEQNFLASARAADVFKSLLAY